MNKNSIGKIYATIFLLEHSWPKDQVINGKATNTIAYSLDKLTPIEFAHVKEYIEHGKLFCAID